MRHSLQNNPDLNEAQIAQKKSLQRFSAVLFAVSVSISLLFHPFVHFVMQIYLGANECVCLPLLTRLIVAQRSMCWLSDVEEEMKAFKVPQAGWMSSSRAGRNSQEAQRWLWASERASERVGWCAGEWRRGQMWSLIGFVKGRLVKVQTEMVWFKCLHYILFYKAKWCWGCLINNKRSRLVHYNVKKGGNEGKMAFLD